MQRIMKALKGKVENVFALIKSKKLDVTLFSSFLEEQRSFQLKMIRILGVVIPLGQSFYLITALLSGYSPISIAVTLAGMFAGLALIAIVFRWQRARAYLPLLLTLTLLIWQATAIEILREVLQDLKLSQITTLHFGICVGFSASFIMVSGVKWQYLGAYFLIYAFIWYVRMTMRDTRPESRYEQILLFLLMFTGFTVMFRKKQLMEFRSYKAKAEFEENLRNFKILIKEVLPEHIIIVAPSGKQKSEEISLLFVNDSASRRFKIRDEQELLGILQRLRIDEPYSSELSNLSDSLMKKKKLAFKSTLNLIQGMCAEEIQETLTNFKTYHVSMNESGSSSKILELGEANVDENSFELKLGKTSWEANKDALILVLTDISQMQRLTKQRMMHQKKDQFLSTFTHEIRTPINSIVGMVQDALDLTASLPQVQKSLQIALCSAKALILKVGDLLDLSAINYNSVQLKLESAGLIKTLDEVVEISSPSITQRGLKLIKDYRVGSEIRVFSDKLRLQQILNNLLTNAIKFTSSGFIRVGISEEREDNRQSLIMDETMHERSQRVVKIEVEDSGKGIEEERKKHLFRLFEKFESVGKTTGVGLGLAVSQKLLSLITGSKSKIGVKSALGQGSTFLFSLAIEQPEINLPKEDVTELASSQYFDKHECEDAPLKPDHPECLSSTTIP